MLRQVLLSAIPIAIVFDVYQAKKGLRFVDPDDIWPQKFLKHFRSYSGPQLEQEMLTSNKVKRLQLVTKGNFFTYVHNSISVEIAVDGYGNGKPVSSSQGKRLNDFYSFYSDVGEKWLYAEQKKLFHRQTQM